jgi:hypothetical protein
MDLDSKGYSQREIAAKLQIAKGTVTNDMTYLKQQAQQRLHVHIQEVIPLEFQRGMNVLRQILKSSLEIGESTADPRIRLEANRIASDTVKHIQEMMTGGAICSEAFRLVSEKGMQKNMETIEMLDKRMAESKAQTEEGEETTEETTTTNDVF